MYIKPEEMLKEAANGQYAIAAFNFYNLETLMAIIEAAEEEKSPVIAQIYSTHYEFFRNGGAVAKAALQLVEESAIPMYLHLDHGQSLDTVNHAIQMGFHSVMFDGSALPLEENIRLSKMAVSEAHEHDIFTEVELGRIGRFFPDGQDLVGSDSADTSDAVKLIEESGADSLAPAIGTAHGIYKTTPKLDFERLQEMCAELEVPLVLHGGSGIPEDMIRRAIALGVTKINVGTELKYCWSDTMKDGLNRGIKEPIALANDAKDAVKEIAKSKIRLFGSNGKC